MDRVARGAALHSRLRSLGEERPITTWCHEQREGGHIALTLTLHVQPGARRSEIAGVHGEALRIRLAAPAVEGKANAELVRFLGEAFGVPLRQVILVRGETSRQKVVRVSDPRQRPDREWP